MSQWGGSFPDLPLNPEPVPPCFSPAPTHRGLFKTDRVLGTAQLKLDSLETSCEVREVLEVRREEAGVSQLC